MAEHGWRKIEIGVHSGTAVVWKSIQDSFEAAFIVTGAPERAAMYFSSEPGGPVTLYFSPGASAIFSGGDWGAQPCARPRWAGLLVGHDSARDLSSMA